MTPALREFLVGLMPVLLVGIIVVSFVFEWLANSRASDARQRGPRWGR